MKQILYISVKFLIYKFMKHLKYFESMTGKYKSESSKNLNDVIEFISDDPRISNEYKNTLINSMS